MANEGEHKLSTTMNGNRVYRETENVRGGEKAGEN